VDKPAARTRTQQPPRKAPPPLPPEPAEPSRLYSLLHVAITGVLALAVVIGGGLLLAGKLRLVAAAAAKDKEKPDEGGRYRIEPVDDVRGLLTQAGTLGFLGDNTEEVWVYKYRGGFLECSLEAESFGNQAGRGSIMPDNWPRVLAGLGGPEVDMGREGYIVVAAMRPVISIGEAVESHYPHLGGLFGVGPAGPLHQLTTCHVDSSHWRFYRILLMSAPPEGQGGERHNLWAAHQVNIRLPMIPRHPSREEYILGGGKDLEAGKEVLLLDRQRGFTRIRLNAKFLTDAQVLEQAAKPAK